MEIDQAVLPRERRRMVAALGWVLLLAFFFAQIEIQIEGAAGWAAALPTWRIEQHWLLDIFWGGRAMTGYHAWVFPFIALMFHFPLLMFAHWSWRAEARVIACIMLFWLVEDFLWFVLNPAFGIARFTAADVAWHKHWLGGVPMDYWIFSVVALVLLRWSCTAPKTTFREALVVLYPADCDPAQ